MKTVLITGCSSGYGLETAHRFHDEGWNVIATMRTPPRPDLLPRSERMHVAALDVTKPESIAAAVQTAGGPSTSSSTTRASVQSAPLRPPPMKTIRELFETNTFGGVIAMTQAVVPPDAFAPFGRRRQRHLQCDADRDAAGSGLHRQQDGRRRVHRVAGSRARLLRRPGQTR